MALYRVLKEFVRHLPGHGDVKVKRNQLIRLELRTESEKLLKDGFITKDTKVRIPVVRETERPPEAEPFFSPEQQTKIEEFADAAGMPLAAAQSYLRRRMGEDRDFEKALRDARKAQGLLTDKEQIEEAAEALGEPEEELQAEIYEWMKTHGLSLRETIQRYSLAREFGKDPEDVFADFQQLTVVERMTPADAMTRLRAHYAVPAEPKKEPETPDAGAPSGEPKDGKKDKRRK